MKKWICAGVGVLLLLLGGVLYVEDYYHAGEAAVAVSAQAEAVDNGKELIFMPDGETPETGLIFYPGGKVEYTAYAPLMEKLRERGILCVLLKMPCNLAFLDIGGADDVLGAFPEVESWYIGGHSLGGVAAGVYAEQHSDELEGLILLGSYTTSDLRETELDVLTVYGSEDGVLNRESYAKYAEGLPESWTELVLEGGCHAGFGDYGEQKGDGSPTISHEEQMEQTAEVITAFVTEKE